MLFATILLAAFWLLARLWLYAKHKSQVRTMIVLGSGGHTAEMFKLLQHFNKAKYTPRTYVAAQTDKLASSKVRQYELSWTEGGAHQETTALHYTMHQIPRSREVGQAWVTSAVSTLWASIYAIAVVWSEWPSLLLVNGPGTCLPICAVAHAFRMIGWLNVRIVFVESIARTQRLSMTGKILYHLRLTDEFLVQWPQLAQRFPRARYSGRVYQPREQQVLCQ
eukprot:TRINITY_DN2484_c0_g1_i2.p1 TRINITY_DN2484_c0_g1~~TRINITY_DN2484_c0_g1_i2.p1  ORF type:complete len:222 (-),score=-1.70 TRINITY_DN2484_c0_g1_i2:58-723(-)